MEGWSRIFWGYLITQSCSTGVQDKNKYLRIGIIWRSLGHFSKHIFEILLFRFVQQFDFIFFRILIMARYPVHLITGGPLQRTHSTKPIYTVSRLNNDNFYTDIWLHSTIKNTHMLLFQQTNFFFILTFSYKASMVSRSTTELSTLRTAGTLKIFSVSSHLLAARTHCAFKKNKPMIIQILSNSRV